ncbi:MULTISPECIES: GNAT family N-acetyltransferase [unclassified Corynebacterium]|uniref:GNAT family N-acetyltransferase n=1 Tax=unclassified Corynebacterium TaxID=2624378 RepID=UPI00264DB7BD|nr:MULTISPECIES: GNAT family protein [unclassified Corynebacterium]MDN8594859.1 GNAT family protein [Corynebacterium sp. P4_F2]WKK56495.1 GNAT family protein [Corynebacterium sp. P4-C1]WKK63930.1 GNAT family protein [Corynebacterium sp. P8-C1]
MFSFFGRASHPGWPEASPTVHIPGVSTVRLRPLNSRDGKDWSRMRIRDEAVLRPVEPTVPGTWEEAHSPAAWRVNWQNLRKFAQDGIIVPLAIELDGRFIGQVTLGNIQHGAIGECWIGYWVYSRYSGRGIATVACALGVDHAFARIGLHRVTATYLPDNPASGKVLANSGFREEGYLHQNLHIDGAWRDHHFVAQNIDDLPGSAVERLATRGRCWI